MGAKEEHTECVKVVIQDCPAGHLQLTNARYMSLRQADLQLTHCLEYTAGKEGSTKGGGNQ